MAKKTTQAKAAKQPAKQAKKPIDKPQKPPIPVAMQLKKKDGPLWDLKKLEKGHILSMTSYMRVLKIASMVTVRNQYGHVMQMSKELLETMYSADHFEREIPLNMTGLAELLQNVQDNVFTIEFQKQASESNAIQALTDADTACFKDPKKMKDLAKQLISGQPCKMTCHMVQVENNLGRSLVIDLNADSDNKFRQVDHRTIESIIFKNVKYSLKKGGKSFSDIDTNIPKDESKWQPHLLAIGNIFSGTSYYEMQSEINDKEVFCLEKNFNDRGVTIDKEIMRDNMNSANVWDYEEQISMTNLASKLTEANNMCFQVQFTTKPSEKRIVEMLSELKKAPKDAKEIKELAKECLTGSENTQVCRLSKAEGKLGRSLVVELSSMGYR
jgi:hypothetical protein